MNQEVGYVLSSKNFLVFLDGMPSIKINDMVISEDGLRGWVNALYKDKVEVLILDEGNVSPGTLFKKLDKKLAIGLGVHLLGRSINPLGVAIDGKRWILDLEQLPSSQLDGEAKGISSRKFITQQFETGMLMVDTLVPIGRGQREMVIGDAHSGKTSFLIDLIVNQKKTGVVCIYASIGKPIAQVKTLIEILTHNAALDHSIIIAASSSDPVPLIYLTPQTAFTIAEYFQRSGRDVLLILDDLGVHAKIYREISLLAGKSPGRESYPGDIFFQHSHLMERAGSFNDSSGSGSITAIPVMELNVTDFTTFIPTNLMGMTDGHLMFKAALHNQGQYPAIDVDLSVSRVGRQTQKRAHNIISGKIRQIIAQAEDLETVSKFSTELPPETRIILKRKAVIDELVRQETLENIPIDIQIILLGLVFTDYFLDKEMLFVKTNKMNIIKLFLADPQFPDMSKVINEIKTEEQLMQYLKTLVPKLVNLK